MNMMILAPPKVLHRWSTREVNKIDCDSIVFVTADCPRSEKLKIEASLSGHNKFVYIDEYSSSAVVSLILADIVASENISHISAMSEVDVMRAARLREYFELPGLKPEFAIRFRDKWLMKKHCEEKGIRCANYKVVFDPLTLLSACDELGYPVVVKPTMGRGSFGVEVLADEAELRDFLCTYVWNDLGAQIPLLVEQYIQGDLYRVDGVVHNGKIVFISTARYWGTHLDYLEGGALGSIVLDPESPLSHQLIEMTSKVLIDALQYDGSGGFHVEIFQTDNGELVFSEAAARLGGGSIVEEVEMAYGVNIKTLAAAAESATSTTIDNLLAQHKKHFTPAAQLHISPKHAKLMYVPEECPFSEVVLYEVFGESGDDYNLMSHTNSELARFLLTSPGVCDLDKLLGDVNCWFSKETKWKACQ